MASREQTIKRWIVIASLTLMFLIAGIATLLWFESRHRNAIISEQLSLKNELRNVVIKRPGKMDIKMQAQDDLWLIQEPCTIAVNQKRLQPLLSIMPPAAFSYAAAEVDLEAAGLINPLATVIANNQRIDIGNTDLTGERRYVKRDERVEFIPEWILPLLDGGLSALSTLELFDDTITSVTVEKLAEQYSTLSEAPAHWQQLTAQQITIWPLSDTPPLQHRYSVTVKSESAEESLQVYASNAYAAIVFEGTRCAYLLPNDALTTVLH